MRRHSLTIVINWHPQGHARWEVSVTEYWANEIYFCLKMSQCHTCRLLSIEYTRSKKDFEFIGKSSANCHSQLAFLYLSTKLGQLLWFYPDWLISNPKGMVTKIYYFAELFFFFFPCWTSGLQPLRLFLRSSWLNWPFNMSGGVLNQKVTLEHPRCRW